MNSQASDPIRILYVEDNPLVREVTAELLMQDGRELVAKETAEDALAEYCERPCHLVITDVSLPVMSGLDLTRNLLRLRADLPVIIASGYALDFGAEQWGPNVRSIIKPFEIDDIEELIASLKPLKL